jgi:hypothetical protein
MDQAGVLSGRRRTRACSRRAGHVRSSAWAASRWAVAARAAWFLLITYLIGALFLVSRYQPKLVAEQSGYQVSDSLYSTVGGQAYWALGSVWQYNRYVVPMLVVVAVGLTGVGRPRSHGADGRPSPRPT